MPGSDLLTFRSKIEVTFQFSRLTHRLRDSSIKRARCVPTATHGRDSWRTSLPIADESVADFVQHKQRSFERFRSTPVLFSRPPGAPAVRRQTGVSAANDRVPWHRQPSAELLTLPPVRQDDPMRRCHSTESDYILSCNLCRTKVNLMTEIKRD